jgi:hypothetical protein
VWFSVGNYSVDQTLAKISNRLEELEEHQRLSRFDAVMFLAYPLITLVMTALANINMQKGNPVFQQIKFFGIWSPNDAFNAVYSPFVIFVVGGFVYFVLSYLRDDLNGRMYSVFFVVLGSFMILFGLLMSPIPWPLLGNETAEAPRNLAAIVELVKFVYGMICFGFGAFYGGVLLGRRMLLKVCIWLRQNTPKMAAAAVLEPNQFWNSGVKRLAKQVWGAVFLPSYTVAVVLSIAVSLWSVGYVGGTILYHFWGLVALVVFTILFAVCTQGDKPAARMAKS